MSRVLLSAYSCSPGHGSEAGNGWHWARSLAAAGHEVTCFTADRNREAIERGLEQVDGPLPRFEYPRLSKRNEQAYSKHFGQVEWGNYYHYLAWQHSLRRVVANRTAEFDVAHHVSWGSLQLGSGLSGLDLPLVVGPLGGGQMAPASLRSYFASTWYLERTRELVSRLLLHFNPLTRRTLHRSQLILATNKETALLSQRHGARNVELFLDSGLPDDFPLAEAPSLELHHPLRLLWIGRMFERKGLGLVLDAVAEASKRLDLRLTVVGDGPEHGGQVARAEALGLGSVVDFVGRVDWTDLKEVTAQHDLLVFCTLRDSFGSQFLEAMALGLPVVCLDRSGPAVFLSDDACWRVPVGSAEETIRGIVDAIGAFSVPEVHRAASVAAWRFARLHTWNRRAAAAQDWYTRAQALAAGPPVVGLAGSSEPSASLLE